jgi:hypothetical protein
VPTLTRQSHLDESYRGVLTYPTAPRASASDEGVGYAASLGGYASSLGSSRGIVQRGGGESAFIAHAEQNIEESVGGSEGFDCDNWDECVHYDMSEIDHAYTSRSTLISSDSCEITKSKGETEIKKSKGKTEIKMSKGKSKKNSKESSSISRVDPSPPLIAPVSATKLADVVVPTAVNRSYVAGIRHGEKLDVYSDKTGVEYLYDLHSPKCILGMSIIDDLVIGTPKQIDVVEASVILKEYAERLNKHIFEDVKVFNQENCVVCLDEKVNIVLLRCGHLCACSMECAGPFDKCPICRTKIVHKIEKSKLVSCI